MKPKAIRGMNDILPGVSATWRHLEHELQEIVRSYGYDEIRLPILEYTELFRRSIGEVTDIVEKEMYTFEDRNGESLTMRPEATASVVRAGITNGLLHNQRQKLWTSGPMFRSTDEWLMSRSCHSATFSCAGITAMRTRRARPVRFSVRIGFRLCGIAEEPF